MTIQERMAAGLLFTDEDAQYPEEAAQLAAARQKSKALCWEINRLHPSETEKRTELLHHLLGSMGDGCWLEPPVYMSYGSNVTMGCGVYANFGLTIIDDWKVTIGNRVLFGPHVCITATSHPLHPDLRQSGEMYTRPVVIGDNAFIGSCTVICPGVTIGEGSTIGAGSVVTRDIPPRVFAAGNPCRVIREIGENDRHFPPRDAKY